MYSISFHRPPSSPIVQLLCRCLAVSCFSSSGLLNWISQYDVTHILLIYFRFSFSHVTMPSRSIPKYSFHVIAITPAHISRYCSFSIHCIFIVFFPERKSSLYCSLVLVWLVHSVYYCMFSEAVIMQTASFTFGKLWQQNIQKVRNIITTLQWTIYFIRPIILFFFTVRFADIFHFALKCHLTRLNFIKFLIYLFVQLLPTTICLQTVIFLALVYLWYNAY